jgi:hypothetical protein
MTPCPTHRPSLRRKPVHCSTVRPRQAAYCREQPRAAHATDIAYEFWSERSSPACLLDSIAFDGMVRRSIDNRR